MSLKKLGAMKCADTILCQPPSHPLAPTLKKDSTSFVLLLLQMSHQKDRAGTGALQWP